MKRRMFFCFLMVSFLALAFGGLRSSAQGSSRHIYWADHRAGKIQRANLDGTNLQDIITRFDHPKAIILDMTGRKMYWSDHEGGGYKIRRSNLNGTDIENLIISDSLTTVDAIALDTAGGKMYWATWNYVDVNYEYENKIQRSNLDGSNVEDLVTRLVSQPREPSYQGPRGIALDLSQRKIYWANCGAGKIQRSNLDGSNVEDLVTELPCPVGIALDFSSRKIYWTDWEAGKIQRANFNGSNLETLVIGLLRPPGITVDSLNRKIYWTDYSTRKIQQANLDGTNVKDFVTGLNGPLGITLSTLQTSISFAIPSTVSVGEEFTATLNLANAVDLAGVQLSLRFNPDVLEVTDIHEGDLLSGTGAFFQVEHLKSVPGEISGIRLARTGGVDGDGTLLKVDFKAKAGGVSKLEVRDLKLGSSTGVPITSVGGSAEVEVKARPDVTGDGKVDILDLVLITRHFGPVSAASQSLDLNGDGDIDILDLILVTQHLGK